MLFFPSFLLRDDDTRRIHDSFHLHLYSRSSTKCGSAQVVELSLDEAENTIQDYLDLCNQEGSSHHHHRRPSSLSDSPFPEEEGGGRAGGGGGGTDNSGGSISPSHERNDDDSKVDASHSGALDSPLHFPLSSTTTATTHSVVKMTSTPVVGKKHNYMRPFKCSECGKRSNW